MKKSEIEKIKNPDLSKIKEGDLIICIGKSWISKAIMFFTKGIFSHTAYASSAWGNFGVIEAQRNGVNFKIWEVWRRKWNYDFVVFREVEPLNSRQLKAETKKAFSVCGETKYDYFTFFRRAFGDRKERDISKEEKKKICSEFTGWLKNLPGWYDMTPQEQFDFLINSDSYRIIS